MDFILGMTGLAGGVLCAVADILLDLKGRGNNKIGKYKIMDSNWIKMAGWRFPASIALAAAALPMCYMGIVAMHSQMHPANSVLADIFWLAGTIGLVGGLFIHATLCYFPMIYKRLHAENKARLAEEMIDDIFRSISVPFCVLYLLLTIFTSAIMITAILTGVLVISKIFVFLNPLGLILIGNLFRIISRKTFADLPGICMPSLGLGMIGLGAALNSLQ